MTEKVTMKHKNYQGQANVRPDDVKAWQSKGWQEVAPARGEASAKKRAPQDAKMKGQKDES